MRAALLEPAAGPPPAPDPEIDLGQEADWDAEDQACSADPAYFVDQFGIIDKPKGPVGDIDLPADPETDGEPVPGQPGLVRFRLWPAQIQTMGVIATERLVSILKARQLGISWLVCAYCLWLCLYSPNQAVFLYSKGQKEANELIRRIRVLYERLPEWLRRRRPRLAGKVKIKEIEWRNGSKVQSMPATKNAGISYTASLVVLDEWAHLKWGEELYESVKPIMEAGGQLIILSTANGFGNWFHELWTKAVKRLSTFRTVFLPWWVRPGRDLAWYARVLADANDPEKVLENYPANPIEAFRSSGKARFPHAWIINQTGNLRDPLPEWMWPPDCRSLPRCAIYALPIPSRRYLVAADVAEGKETSNYDAAVVIDTETWEEVAFIHGQWEPDLYATYLMRLGRAYAALDGQRGATILPERNNHGHAVLATLRLKGYANIGDGHDGDPGWLTNTQTKDPAIDLLAEALRCGLLTVRSAAALDEMAIYQRLKKGKTGAPTGGKFFDDCVMAWAIGLAWLRHERSRPRPEPPAVGGPATGPVGHLPAPGPLRTPRPVRLPSIPGMPR